MTSQAGSLIILDPNLVILDHRPILRANGHELNIEKN